MYTLSEKTYPLLFDTLCSAQNTTYGRSPRRPTVGRLDDPR
ncbi:hypothetical protein HMPREF1556_00973 [Porphyromonas sp. oral taxon 278 str. W7784]|nr:hypothetical protein HMPREF1556_00973 [Porphyromonas sp. oral taxon 278 str. W7784]